MAGSLFSDFRVRSLCVTLTLWVMLGCDVTSASGCTVPSDNQLHSQWTKLLHDQCTHTGVGLENIAGFEQMHRENGRMLAARKCHVECVDEHCTGDEVFDSCGPLVDDCPVQPSNDIAADARLRSLCPWAFDMTTDMRRYPTVLVEARCCWPEPRGNYPVATACEKVRYNLPIMYQTGEVDGAGLCLYDWKIESIAVGCASAMRESSS